MLVGASTGALYPQYLTEDAVEVLARLDFPSIEVMLQTAGEYEPVFVEQLSARVRDSGAQVFSVHAFTSLHPVFDHYSRRRQEGFDRFAQVIELAAAVDASYLVWHGMTLRSLDGGATEADFQDVLGRVSEKCEAAGVRLTLENVSWCWLRDASAIQTVRDWKLPVDFTFDPFQSEESGIEGGEMLAAMGQDLANVHVSDYTPGGSRHLPIGAGAIDWTRILRLLEDIGYEGPLMLECDCDGDLERLGRSRDILAALLGEPSTPEPRQPIPK